MDAKFLDFLERRQSFLLTGHEHPDGDCVGAQTALFHLLRARGKDAYIVNPDPISRGHDFLERHTPFDSYRAGSALPAVDAAVLLDCAQLGRLAALGPALQDAGVEIAVVDHHIGSEEGDGSVFYVDSDAPSTGTLVHRLYHHFAEAIPPAAAEGLFLSLVADTGWFRYSNTTAEVHRLASELVELGVEPAVMYDEMFRRNHPASIEFFASVLLGHGNGLGGRYAWAAIDKVGMDRASRIAFETDGIIEVMRSVEGMEVVALFKERFDGAVKVSLRSARDVDVCEIARQFGGGGHRKAAGAVMHEPLDSAIKTMEGRVEAALAAHDAAGTRVRGE